MKLNHFKLKLVDDCTCILQIIKFNHIEINSGCLIFFSFFCLDNFNLFIKYQ